MRLPRNVSGDDLVKALRGFGYVVTRQTGSHVRMTTQEPSEHHITVPLHYPLRVGTLSGIVADVAEHARMSRDHVVEMLFGRH